MQLIHLLVAWTYIATVRRFAPDSRSWDASRSPPSSRRILSSSATHRRYNFHPLRAGDSASILFRDLDFLILFLSVATAWYNRDPRETAGKSIVLIADEPNWAARGAVRTSAGCGLLPTLGLTAPVWRGPSMNDDTTFSGFIRRIRAGNEQAARVGGDLHPAGRHASGTAHATGVCGRPCPAAARGVRGRP
jgi:hypothetical protein